MGAALSAAGLLLGGCRGTRLTETESKSAALASSQDADGYVYEPCEETVYAIKDVNIRTEATAKSDSEGILKQGESITRVAYNYSWSKVAHEGKICYMATQFLSTEPVDGQSD